MGSYRQPEQENSPVPDYLINDIIGRRIDATMPGCIPTILIKLWLMKETFAKVFADTVNVRQITFAHLFSELENNSLRFYPRAFGVRRSSGISEKYLI